MNSKEKILSLINSLPDNIFFVPNISVNTQVGLIESKKVLKELAEEGLIIAVKVPKYRGSVLHNLAVLQHQDFDWGSMFDPDNFFPLTKEDVEISVGYKKKPMSWENVKKQLGKLPRKFRHQKLGTRVVYDVTFGGEVSYRRIYANKSSSQEKCSIEETKVSRGKRLYRVLY